MKKSGKTLLAVFSLRGVGGKAMCLVGIPLKP
jgi:hypothetical protein